MQRDIVELIVDVTLIAAVADPLLITPRAEDILTDPGYLLHLTAMVAWLSAGRMLPSRSWSRTVTAASSMKIFRDLSRR